MDLNARISRKTLLLLTPFVLISQSSWPGNPSSLAVVVVVIVTIAALKKDARPAIALFRSLTRRATLNQE